MLNLLHIENVAVIEKADVAFSEGLSVLTGETGAGKSIVIDALGAVLGGRTSREIIRSGAKSALVSAVFDCPKASSWCLDNGIELEDDELILTRKISTAGKNNCLVNGCPVTVTQLRNLGTELLDIHGQNDGQKLLDESYHLNILDSFGHLAEDIAAYLMLYESIAP